MPVPELLYRGTNRAPQSCLECSAYLLRSVPLTCSLEYPGDADNELELDDSINSYRVEARCLFLHPEGHPGRSAPCTYPRHHVVLSRTGATPSGPLAVDVWRRQRECRAFPA